MRRPVALVPLLFLLLVALVAAEVRSLQPPDPGASIAGLRPGQDIAGVEVRLGEALAGPSSGTPTLGILEGGVAVVLRTGVIEGVFGPNLAFHELRLQRGEVLPEVARHLGDPVREDACDDVRVLRYRSGVLALTRDGKSVLLFGLGRCSDEILVLARQGGAGL